MPFWVLFLYKGKGPYEEIRYFRGSYTTPVGSAIVANLDGALSADTTLPGPHKVSELFAVSGSARARRNLCSSSAAGYPRVAGK